MKDSSVGTGRIGAISPTWWCVAISAAILGSVLETPAGGDATQGEKPADASPFELTAGVVIDPVAHLACVMSEKGGIDAVDLQSGERRWHSKDGDKPIALADHLLLAMEASSSKGQVLGLVVLDIHADGRSVRTQTVELPASVVTGVDDLRTSEFMIGGKAAGRDVAVSWAFASHLRRARGRLPPGEEGFAADPPVARGAFRIDLATGATSDATSGADLVPFLSSRPLSATEQLPIDKGVQFVSADGSHVLSAARVSRAATEDRYVWTLSDRASGRELGRMRTRWSSGPFFMSSNDVIFLTHRIGRWVEGKVVEEGVRVRAVDLDSGKERWVWPIRDTSFHGPTPD